MRNLIPSWPVTRVFTAFFAVGLLALFATGCDDEASPTTPMPAPAPAPAPMPEPEPEPIQAGEVVDRETLKLFVEAAAQEAADGHRFGSGRLRLPRRHLRARGSRGVRGRSTCSSTTATEPVSSTRWTQDSGGAEPPGARRRERREDLRGNPRRGCGRRGTCRVPVAQPRGRGGRGDRLAERWPTSCRLISEISTC